MTFLRRHLGVRHRVVLWTLALAGGGGLAIQRLDVQRRVAEIDPELAAFAGLPTQIGVVLAVWLGGVVLFRRGEWRVWQRLLANSPFEAQHDQARRPPLQNEYKRKTITVETGSNLREVFDPEVQSALMDISIPGTLRVTHERVTYEVPFTRLRPEELGTVARAVATIAARLERLARKGHR